MSFSLFRWLCDFLEFPLVKFGQLRILNAKKKVGVVQVVSSLLVNLRLWLLELVCGQIDFPEKTSTKSSKIVITSLRHFYSISQKETQGKFTVSFAFHDHADVIKY